MKRAGEEHSGLSSRPPPPPPPHLSCLVPSGWEAARSVSSSQTLGLRRACCCTWTLRQLCRGRASSARAKRNSRRPLPAPRSGNVGAHEWASRWRGRVVGLFGSAPDADLQSSSRPDGSPGSTGEAWPQSSLRVGTAFLGELRPMPLPKWRPVLTEQGSKMKSENISLPCPPPPRFLLNWGVLPLYQCLKSNKKNSDSASRACEQTKRSKNLVGWKCKLNIFFFSPGKKCTSSFTERSEEQVSQNCGFFLPRFLSYPVFRSSFELASPYHWFCYVKFLFVSFFFREEEAIENVCLASLSSAVSRRQQDKVVVDVHHRHVEGRHLVDAQRLVHGRVQLLNLQLPLHPLHGVEGRRLVLLPHQQTRLVNKPVVSLRSLQTEWKESLRVTVVPSCDRICRQHPGSKKWTGGHWSDLSPICSRLPEKAHNVRSGWTAISQAKNAQDFNNFLYFQPLYLALWWHVVHFGVEQHGASAKWHSLIGYCPGCPAVDPQDLLLARNNQLLLWTQSKQKTKNKKTSESRRGECDSDKREGNNGVKAGKKWIPHPLYAVL